MILSPNEFIKSADRLFNHRIVAYKIDDGIACIGIRKIEEKDYNEFNDKYNISLFVWHKNLPPCSPIIIYNFHSLKANEVCSIEYLMNGVRYSIENNIFPKELIRFISNDKWIFISDDIIKTDNHNTNKKNLENFLNEFKNMMNNFFDQLKSMIKDL